MKKVVAKKPVTVTKPILVARKEFADNLIKLINDSGLPLVVIQPIMDDVAENVRNTLTQQYLNEKATYEKALEESKKEADAESAESEA